MSKRKAIMIFGSTGSVGTSTLEVVRAFPELFDVVGLAAKANVELLASQVREFGPRAVALLEERDAERLRILIKRADTEILWGQEGYQRLPGLVEAELAVSAMVGAAGLMPTMAALRAGCNVALANKESLVMAGDLVMKEALARGLDILPVDSEHSAIFQCLKGNSTKHVRSIILTASGGPFWERDARSLEDVTPEEAVAHPTWSMGPKISVDSATLMNKGLEVIEAKWLFGLSDDQIAVSVHPQSIIHSLVEFVDGSVLAQMGYPDMKVPIAYALSYPERLPLDGGRFEPPKLGPLTFEEPDLERFPCLGLAFRAARVAGTLPTVMNAANEVAVELFLARRIPFTAIPGIIEMVMDEHRVNNVAADLEEILRADQWARRRARELARALAI